MYRLLRIQTSKNNVKQLPKLIFVHYYCIMHTVQGDDDKDGSCDDNDSSNGNGDD